MKDLFREGRGEEDEDLVWKRRSGEKWKNLFGEEDGAE